MITKWACHANVTKFHLLRVATVAYLVTNCFVKQTKYTPDITYSMSCEGKIWGRMKWREKSYFRGNGLIGRNRNG